jgi:hypothetical protein
VVAKVRSLSPYQAVCELALFCDTADGQPPDRSYIRRGLQATFTGGTVAISQYSQAGGRQSLGSKSGVIVVGSGVCRMAYDPAAGKVRVWLDRVDLGAFDVPDKPVSGKYVLFEATQPIEIESLQVLRGVVPPPDEVKPVAGGVTILMVNGDRLTARGVGLADGKLSLGMQGGELRLPIGAVKQILFPPPTGEDPRRRAADVRVRVGASLLTLVVERLTADELIGRSEVLGDVKIRRAAVREIRLRPYLRVGPFPRPDPNAAIENIGRWVEGNDEM